MKNDAKKTYFLKFIRRKKFKKQTFYNLEDNKIL